MKIEFIATFEGSSCINLDDEMAAKLKFTADGSQLPNIIKLTIYKKKRMRITVEEDKAP